MWFSSKGLETTASLFHRPFIFTQNFAGKGARVAKMMPVQEGDDWRVLRNTISPTFSTGKIRLVRTRF